MCSGSGGTAPYSYLWLYVSGDNLTEPVNDSSSTGNWTRVVPSITVKTSTWRCQVIDSTSASANSSNVAVSIRGS